jgi:hypothetical protein
MICNQLLNHKTNSYSQMSTSPICKYLKKLVDMLFFKEKFLSQFEILQCLIFGGFVVKIKQQ